MKGLKLDSNLLLLLLVTVIIVSIRIANEYVLVEERVLKLILDHTVGYDPPSLARPLFWRRENRRHQKRQSIRCFYSTASQSTCRNIFITRKFYLFLPPTHTHTYTHTETYFSNFNEYRIQIIIYDFGGRMEYWMAFRFKICMNM